MITSDQARELDVCPGCGEPKEPGLIVCWPCFKYREDIVPYKDFDGTFEQWCNTVPETWKTHIAQGR